MDEVSRLIQRRQQRIALMFSGIVLSLPIIYLLYYFTVYAWTSSRFRAESEHGIHLPDSIDMIQCHGDAWMPLDRGAGTLVMFDWVDMATFEEQLQVENVLAVSPNAKSSSAAHDSMPMTFASVSEYFDRRWKGSPVPVKWLDCKSPTGDALGVRIYRLNDKALVEIHTDWN